MGSLVNVIAKHATSSQVNSPTQRRFDWFGMKGRHCIPPRDGFLIYSHKCTSSSVHACRLFRQYAERSWVACLSSYSNRHGQVYLCGDWWDRKPHPDTGNDVVWSNGRTMCRQKAQTPSQLDSNCRSSYSQRAQLNNRRVSRLCKINLLIIATILHFV